MNALRRWRRPLITLLVGIAMAMGVLLSRGTFSQTDRLILIRDFSDALFVPGVLLVCLGALVFVASNGVFDMLSFGIKKVAGLVRSEKFRAQQPRTYYDYVKLQGEKPRSSYGHLLKVGGGFLLIAMMLVLLYETV